MCLSPAWLLAFLAVSGASGQANLRPKDVRDIARAGSSAVPKLQALLTNPSPDVRAEAVRQITEIGPPYSLDPLIQASRDGDPVIQMLAADGLVNFYLPGYAKHGVSGTIERVGTSIKSKFTDTNDQVIDAYIAVRPDVIAALAEQLRSGNMDVRANAARAEGVLRGKAAVGDLVAALRSKDSTLIYESLVALEKIADESAGTAAEFLLHDFDPKVQMAAVEAVGVLRDAGAVRALADVIGETDNPKVKRAALTSLAMLPNPAYRGVFQQYFHDKDEKLRGAAAEGLGRLKNPLDLPTLQQAWKEEGRPAVRLSLAFAQVMLGSTELGQFSPLQFLINNLNLAAYNGAAEPLLVELARDARVRAALYGAIASGTKDEKIGLARVLGASGDTETIERLKKLMDDQDPAVAQAAIDATRSIRARM
ncbi:MAG: HEAT repeat domain-containing protein [Bryobacteraceae bacterium]|jgi:HEAT repeat protein